MDTNKEIWNNHYKRQKSFLSFPDENLVRILAHNYSEDFFLNYSNNNDKPRALDLGAGSGRHSILLHNRGFETTALDYTEESLHLIRNTYPEIQGIHCEETPYPFMDNSFDLVVAWGVLHYNPMDEIKNIIREIKRVLKPGGFFVGTIRSERDTSIAKEKSEEIQLADLKGGYVQKFSVTDLEDLLGEYSNVMIGIMERSILGNLDTIISHYFFRAKKEDS